MPLAGVLGLTQRCRRLKSAVPAVLGWASFPRAFVSLLVFGFIGVGGEWLVHQLSYAIEYGSRFNQVMAQSPHHLYMGKAGTVLFAIAAASLALLVTTLFQATRAIEDAERRLPSRLAERIAVRAPSFAASGVLFTTGILAGCQATLYVLQENLESAAVSGAWPGLSVLYGSGHQYVLPLHLLVAFASSIVLWTVTALVQGSRQAVQLAKILLAIFVRRFHVPTQRASRPLRLPSLRPQAGDLGLRSPPHASVLHVHIA